MPKKSKPKTIGTLRQSRYKVLDVKREVRKNLIKKIEGNQELFPGIIGFENSVKPQLENAILAGQDIILLGERGQAWGWRRTHDPRCLSRRLLGPAPVYDCLWFSWLLPSVQPDHDVEPHQPF